MKNPMAFAASMKNPPKGYGLDVGLKVAAYRNKRMDYWAKRLGNGYCPEVFARVEQDIIAEFGHPF